MITKILALITLTLLFFTAVSGEKVDAWIPIVWIIIYLIESTYRKNIIIHIGEDK